MSIPTNEQETVIQISRDGDVATIYTSDSTMMTKMRKIYPCHRQHVNRGEVVAEEYRVPKPLISFRKKRVKRTLTAEQKEAMKKNLKAARAKKANATA